MVKFLNMQKCSKIERVITYKDLVTLIENKEHGKGIMLILRTRRKHPMFTLRKLQISVQISDVNNENMF
jgi:hypothetical protein